MPTPYKLPLSSNPECTPLPSDPSLLTREQRRAMFGGDVRGALVIILNAQVASLVHSTQHFDQVSTPSIPIDAAAQNGR